MRQSRTNEVTILIDPVAKPRMTRSDKWKKRDIVQTYWAFKDAITLACKQEDFELSDKYHVHFGIAMPKHWSKKKKEEMYGKPHQSRPDLDNFLKALNDCLKSEEDSAVHYIEAEKYWWSEGRIYIRNL